MLKFMAWMVTFSVILGFILMIYKM